MTLRLTLEDVLAATRVVARIMDRCGGAPAAARLIRARAEGGVAEGEGPRGRMSLAAAARIELGRSGVAAPGVVSQRRLLIAAAAVCAVMAEGKGASIGAPGQIGATAV